MYSVYVLRSCFNDRFYVGYSGNLEIRLRWHNEGRNRSTKSGRPWMMVMHENFQTKGEAIRRERYLKSLKSRVELEKLITEFENRRT